MALKQGISAAEEKRLEFVARIRQSEDAKLIAFECLAWLGEGKEASKFRWLDQPMSEILGDGSEPPLLALFENPFLVGRWVSNQLRPLEDLPAWKAYFAAGRHLWILHCLFQCRDKRDSFVAGLVALANGLAHWQNLQSPKELKKGGVQPMDPRWIARLLESRLTAKYELSKPFVEALYAINAVAEVGACARSELEGVWSQLTEARKELDEEASARQAAVSKHLESVTNLERTQADLESCRLELEAEKGHSVRTGGFTDVSRRETIQQVLSDVRQGLLHRLDDIKNFADRENPNREEILELVSEIQEHLIKLETRLLP